MAPHWGWHLENGKAGRLAGRQVRSVFFVALIPRALSQALCSACAFVSAAVLGRLVALPFGVDILITRDIRLAPIRSAGVLPGERRVNKNTTATICRTKNRGCATCMRSPRIRGYANWRERCTTGPAIFRHCPVSLLTMPRPSLDGTATPRRPWSKPRLADLVYPLVGGRAVARRDINRGRQPCHHCVLG